MLVYPRTSLLHRLERDDVKDMKPISAFVPVWFPGRVHVFWDFLNPQGGDAHGSCPSTFCDGHYEVVEDLVLLNLADAKSMLELQMRTKLSASDCGDLVKVHAAMRESEDYWVRLFDGTIDRHWYDGARSAILFMDKENFRGSVVKDKLILLPGVPDSDP